MTGVPRSITEHRLNIREGYLPVRQKKRGQAPERTKAIQAEVQKFVAAGVMKEVYYHDWQSNPVMRYFQAHPIAVITDQPIKQILADFLVEKPDENPPDISVVETPPEPWTLFIDGSS
ncbi:hypothetical protein Tco_0574337 [Tanacetum coccineum]